MEAQVLNHYRILRPLGKGGMGVVYLAEDSRLGRAVAIKVMAESVANDPEQRQRFLQEARAAAALNHPNIATIHSVEEESGQGTLLLVMEYIEGETLKTLLSSQGAGAGLPAAEAVSLVIPAAAALEHSHRRGVIHRDIKSSNIMRTSDGRVKVLDFGIAKMTGSTVQTDPCRMIGTLDYMSPEQILGDDVDHRTDLWSLGVVLYELLTGQLPFHGDTAAQVLFNIAFEMPKAFANEQASTQIPVMLRDVVQKALAKEAEGRYQTSEQMRQDLAHFLQDAQHAQTVTTARPSVLLQETQAFTPAVSGTSRRNTAERRQITFLCCDLVQHRGNDNEEDPEEYAGALRLLEEICVAAARRYGGHVPDGGALSGIIYFGYPIAHEDDASRAIRAGLQICHETKSRIGESTGRFELHLGVSTSLAIVEFTETKTGRMSDSIIGEGAKVARALTQLPHVDQLLVESSTQRLATRGFAYRELGATPVPGLRGTLQIYAALETKESSVALAGDSHALSTPLVGRKQELMLLEDSWKQAAEGHGQFVLLAGSAGIGKSRLVRELRQRIQTDARPVRTAEWMCSPFYTSSALRPILGWMERTYLEDENGKMPNQEALGRLRRLLDHHELAADTYLRVLAPLFSITPDTAGSGPALTPERQRELAIEALLSILLDSAANQPLLLVVEDLHWADPSTLEVLSTLLDHVPGLPILGLLTHRPEFLPPWGARGHLKSISVNRLQREEVITLAKGVAGDEQLHPSVLEQLIRTAEGTPLFIEELAKMVVESGLATRPLDDAPEGPKLAIPKTLRDSFMARLDRLGEAKHVAQIASVLGREFPRRLLVTIADLTEGELRARLQTLVDAEVLYPRGMLAKQAFVFKHALLQEAAYESLLRRDRVALHQRAAQAITSDATLAVSRPELAGHHFEEAGLHDQAIHSWHRAGMKALEHSAHKEAIAAFRRALRLHRFLPPGPEADATELLLLVSLGPSLVATLGFGADEVGRNFDRARELCTADTGPSLLLPALFGVWVYKLVRGDLDAAEEVAGQLLATGEATGNDDMRIEGYWALGDVQFWRGDLLGARSSIEKAVALYDLDRFLAHAPMFGQDPMVAAKCYRGFVRMLQGDREGAWQSQGEALMLARRLNHAFSIGWALGFPPTMSYFEDDPEASIQHADVALQFYGEQAYPFFVTSCQGSKGWGLCRLGRCEEGLELIRSALSGMRLIGSNLVLPLFTGLLAESLLAARQIERAREAVEEGLVLTRANGDRVTEIILHRISGDIEMQAPTRDLAAARESYKRARALAEAGGVFRYRDLAMERLRQMEAEESGPESKTSSTAL